MLNEHEHPDEPADRYSEVVARLLRPAAPQAVAAAALAHQYDSPPAAWQALADHGLIPQAWTEPGSRCFREIEAARCRRCRGKGRTGGYSGDPDEWEDDAWTCPACNSQGMLIESEQDTPFPPSLAACVALASDPEGVARAEALALECAARLEGWGFASEERIVWRMSGPLPPSQWSLGAPLRIFDFLRHKPREDYRSPAFRAFRDRTETVGTGAFYARAQRHARLDQFWRGAAARGDVVPAEIEGVRGEILRPPAAIADRSFDTLNNPFEPLLAIWRLGYVPVSLAPGPIVLLAPPGSTRIETTGG